MSTGRAASDDRHEGGDCEVRVKGHLDARWADWFGGLSLAHENDGTTVLRGWVVDQAALHGLLSKVRDLGLPLVSVTRVGPDQADVPTIEPHQVPTNSRKEQEQ